MGNKKNKKKRTRTSPETLKHQKPSKQLKIDDLFVETVSTPELNSLFTDNSFLSLDKENRNSGNNSTAYQEGVSLDLCRGDTPGTSSLITELKQPELLQQTNSTSALMQQCLLTAKTVTFIFDKLKNVANQIEQLRLSFDSFVQRNTALRESTVQADGMGPRREATDEKPCTKATRGYSLTSTKCNRILQANQIMLRIAHNNINKGRWRSFRAIRTSLGQLLHIHPQCVDLLKVEWLPQVSADKKIVMTFEQSTLPSMLMKMKLFLLKFQIAPMRVFRDLDISPLITPMHGDDMPVEVGRPSLLAPRETSGRNRPQSSPAKADSKPTQNQSTILSSATCGDQRDIDFGLDHLETVATTIGDMVEPLVGLMSTDESPQAEMDLEVGPVNVNDLLELNEEDETPTLSPIQVLVPRRDDSRPPIHDLPPREGMSVPSTSRQNNTTAEEIQQLQHLRQTRKEKRDPHNNCVFNGDIGGIVPASDTN
ncbi:ras-GEF domain-containing family member 1A isoform X4 [Anolis carolinensis]|uniref:ras-GEF domain-containing family member 1A isoform X4 n=1 Tax=Anolis carolinensis TaxID=28377 RepID=UPI000462D3AF